MSALIKMEHVTKRYGDMEALDDVSLEIPAGKIVGLVGPNGAGKTTLMRALTGLIACQGKIEVLDYSPESQRAELMRRTGVIHDISVLPPWMLVSQLLDFHEAIQSGFRRNDCIRFLETTSIDPSRKIKQLSKGMKTQLHLALMLATDSDLLILDEPTHGLDILFRKQFYNTVLEEYFDQGKSILISTHQIEEVEHVLSDVVFIRDGHILLYDTVENLHKRYLQVEVSDREAEAVRQMHPLTETSLIGKKIFLFEGTERPELEKYGEVRAPSLADIFLVLMGGEA